MTRNQTSKNRLVVPMKLDIYISRSPLIIPLHELSPYVGGCINHRQKEVKNKLSPGPRPSRRK